MADELRLGDLGQAWRLRAPKLGRELGHREIGTRERAGAATWLRLLVEELHACTISASVSARRSISATVRFPVTATSSASSRLA